jgi:hypothetical protein
MMTNCEYEIDTNSRVEFYPAYLLDKAGYTGTYTVISDAGYLDPNGEVKPYITFHSSLKTAAGWSRRDRQFFHLEKARMSEMKKWCRDVIPRGWQETSDKYVIGAAQRVQTALFLRMLNETDEMVFHLAHGDIWLSKEPEPFTRYSRMNPHERQTQIQLDRMIANRKSKGII